MIIFTFALTLTDMYQKIISSISLSLLIWIILFQCACSKDKGKIPFVNKTLCDTMIVTWTTDIQTIMYANCSLGGCHDGVGAPGNFLLYADVNADALNGKLWDRVNTQGDMPPAGKLPIADLQKIDCWIQKGALNN